MTMTQECFPDGSPVSPWFYDLSVPDAVELGPQYVITDAGVRDDGRIYTKAIQALIDRAAQSGGGVIVVPAGTYCTGALFFPQGVHLIIREDGVLKGSDDISDYPLVETRIEGQTCPYFTALINVKDADGFTLLGPGTLDGNGLKSWKAFWLRRKWNPACLNKDEQRARLVYMEHCRNVTVSGVQMRNAQFWTNHLYFCDHVRYLNCRITSPRAPVPAPSTDALDLDVCHDVLVRNCYMAVNDDAVVLKGGKGPWADTAPENGSNERILVEDCTYGFCHGCLTCGSESIHNRNIIIRRITVSEGENLIWLKMRPDTVQHYEYIVAEDMTGSIDTFLNVTPWTQFYDRGGREDMPLSRADHVSIRNCSFTCDTAFRVIPDEAHYHLSHFTLKNLDITAKKPGLDMRMLEETDMQDIHMSIQSGD